MNSTTAASFPPMNAREDNGIEVRGLVKQFRNGPRAVDGIDLDVAPGEIYGFLGPNGAGKSTTVNMLVTLLPPTSGRALVAGWDIATQGDHVRRAIGAALQAVALDPFLTGRDHLKLIASLQGITGPRARDRAQELLVRVGLEDAADRKVGGYSGGMKRRLDLALALVHEPRVLFLDEPTTGLDPQSRTALWEEVRRLARDEGVTVFLTTQYLEEADVLADRVGIIDRGMIVAEGTPAQLKASIGAPTVEVVPCDDHDREELPAVLARFGDPVAPAIPGAVAARLSGGVDRASLVSVVRAIDDAGLRILEVRQHEPTLDDVFLAQTGRTLEGAAHAVDATGDPTGTDAVAPSDPAPAGRIG
jgi:ABC-2 type transport system ATP-binding protein